MRRRILLLVVGMTTLVVLAFAIPLAVLIRSAVAQRAEHAAVDQADNVAIFLRSGTQTDSRITTYVNSLEQSTEHRTWIVLPNCTTVGTMPSAARDIGGQCPPPRQNRGAAPPRAGNAPAQLRDAYGGKVAETFAVNSQGSYHVSVFVSHGALYDGEYQWWVLLIAGSVALLAVGVVVGELVTRRIVRPLEDTAQTAHRISTGDVTARAPVGGPREVAEVSGSLNRLADRIDELIAEERETVADLSHRMRTPLTALRLDAEALHDPDEAERISGHVSALERTLTAVIRAARRPQREGRLPVADATAVVGERLGFWSALTEEQQRAVTSTLPEAPVYVRCSADDLAAALDALIENVIAHTPEGVAFSVLLRETDDGALLEVGDAGPGMPDGVAADGPTRGRSDGSSGLGLDIARQCAAASGGSMVIGHSLSGGALVVLHLGPAASR